MEINRSNKQLLSSMLRMEKDLHSIKQSLNGKESSVKPETMSTTLYTSVIRDRHHYTENRKRKFLAIEKENIRIF